MAFIERLIGRLSLFDEIPPHDKALLRQAVPRSRRLVADQVVLQEGEFAGSCVVVLTGILVALQALPNDKRQIVSAYFPGEISDAHGFCAQPDTALVALNEAVVGIFSCAELKRIISKSAPLTNAFWRQACIQTETCRQWISSNGNRRSIASVAHLLCDFMTRAAAADLLSKDGSWAIPFTQQQLGDALGLSAVHVNRLLGILRQEKAAAIEHGRLRVLNWTKLSAIAGFDPSYLQLGQRDGRL